MRREDGFIMDILACIFNFLSKLSIFCLVKKIWGKKIRKEYTFVEGWVLANLFLAILGSIMTYYVRNKVILWVILIYGFSRVFEILIYQINVILFDPYRAFKKGKKHKIKSASRMLVLLIHNYIEIVFWYTAMASILIIFNESTIESSWLHFVKSSFLCMATFNGNDIISISSILSKIAFFETVTGIILTIISIARCINSLPAVEEVDRIRVSKAKYNIKNNKVKKK